MLLCQCAFIDSAESKEQENSTDTDMHLGEYHEKKKTKQRKESNGKFTRQDEKFIDTKLHSLIGSNHFSG